MTLCRILMITAEKNAIHDKKTERKPLTDYLSVKVKTLLLGYFTLKFCLYLVCCPDGCSSNFVECLFNLNSNFQNWLKPWFSTALLSLSNYNRIMLLQSFKLIFGSTIYPTLTTKWYSRALATYNIPQTAKHSPILKANISFWTFFDRKCHVSANHRKDKLQSVEIIIRNVNNISEKSRTADQWLTLWLNYISIIRICHLWPQMTSHSKDNILSFILWCSLTNTVLIQLVCEG